MKQRVAVTLMGLVALSLLLPAVLWAHARLTRSEPGSSAELRTTPKVIRLWFSEAPEVSVTRVTLRDSAGKDVSLGTPAHGDSRLDVIIPIAGTLDAGKYTVAWKTAADDGHPSSGSFTFVVLPGAVASAIAVPSPPVVARSPEAIHDASMEPSASTPSYVIVRALNFTALLIMIGASAFRVLVLPRAPSLGSRDAILTRTARLGSWAACGVLVTCGLRFLLQSRMMAEMVGASGLSVDTILGTAWGHALLWQCGAALVAALAYKAARMGSVPGWSVAACAALVLAVTPALSGHAGASPEYRSVAVADDALHILAVAGWLGSLLYVAVVGVPTLVRSAHEAAFEDIAVLVNAFSPVALASAALVVITGVVSAWLRLGGLSPLWTTPYGKVLILKLALLVGVLGTGAYNWLRVRPTLGSSSATFRLRRSASAELTIGVLVITVTAVLVAIPTPLDR